MKTKTEKKETASTKPAAITVKDAAYEVLYGIEGKEKTVAWVIEKNVKPTNMQPNATNLIVFWADILKEWLELRVADDFKLVTDTEKIVKHLTLKGAAPTDHHLATPEKFFKKLKRKEKKERVAEAAKAKREGREPVRSTRVKVTNVDPTTNLRKGTRRFEMATVMLSSSDPKKVRAELTKLIQRFLKEKPNATYEKIGLEKYVNQLARWTATDGDVKKEVFEPILKALGL